MKRLKDIHHLKHYGINDGDTVLLDDKDYGTSTSSESDLEKFSN
jgi:hypothetical protein